MQQTEADVREEQNRPALSNPPSPIPHPPSPMRLVVVGGGHASLPLLQNARTLVGAGHEVTLVSDRPELWYSGMTPEWLGGVYGQPDVTVPLGPICQAAGVRFVQGRAVALDRGARAVRLADGAEVGYDVVALDVGAVNPGRDRADGAVRAKPLWRIERLGELLEAGAGEPRRLVVVGGGAAGTECALNVTARYGGRLAVTVVEPGDRLCPALPARLGHSAARTLRQRGAEVRFGARAESAGPDGVRLETGETLAADAVLWATGSVGQPLFREAGLTVTDDGFAVVDRGLRSVDDGRVFVAGDSATVRGHEGLRKVGVHAVKHGPVLRENVAQALAALGRGQDPAAVPLRPFRPYPVTPLVVTTGEPDAWLAVGPFALRGRPWLRLKHVVDRRWIDRYRDGAGYRRLWDARSASAVG